MSIPSGGHPHILAVVGSPSPQGRTLIAARAVLDGVEQMGAQTSVIELGAEAEPMAALAAIPAADGILFASPVYGATFSAVLKALFEQIPRGVHGEVAAPLGGTPTGVLMTGGSAHHLLAVDGLRSLLAGFFAAQVLSPGLYLHGPQFASATELSPEGRDLAESYGRALADFTAAIGSVASITRLRPLA